MFPLLYPERTDVVFRRIQDNPDVIPSFLTTLLKECGWSDIKKKIISIFI